MNIVDMKKQEPKKQNKAYKIVGEILLWTVLSVLFTCLIWFLVWAWKGIMQMVF